MSVWVLRINSGYHPETGQAQQGYTVHLPERRMVKPRILACMKAATGADPDNAVITHANHTPTASQIFVTLAGERFNCYITKHHGSLRHPGVKVNEADPAGP